MSEESTFQPPHVTEAQQALEKERHLPLTGWQQEVSQGLTYGLEGPIVFAIAVFPPFPGVSYPTMRELTPL